MNTKKEICVLIPAIGCNTSISVVKALKLSSISKYRIVATDMLSEIESVGSVFVDKFYTVPRSSDPTYIDSLLEIAINEKVDVILPVMDQDVEVISRNAAKFIDNDLVVCSSDLEVSELCNDKYKTFDFLKKKGIAVPHIYSVGEIISGKLVFPVFLKPRKGVSSIDCYKVDTQEELHVFMKRVDDPIVQDFLDGQHCVIDVVNDVNGKNIVAVPRYEFSAKAGIGVKASIVNDKDLIEYGKLISEVLNIKGAANIEVFKKNNKLSLIEVNSRFSAGVILTAVSGVNVPELVIHLFLGSEIDLTGLKWIEGYYMNRYWLEVFSCNNKIIDSVDYRSL